MAEESTTPQPATTPKEPKQEKPAVKPPVTAPLPVHRMMPEAPTVASSKRQVKTPEPPRVKERHEYSPQQLGMGDNEPLASEPVEEKTQLLKPDSNSPVPMIPFRLPDEASSYLEGLSLGLDKPTGYVTDRELFELITRLGANEFQGNIRPPIQGRTYSPDLRNEYIKTIKNHLINMRLENTNPPGMNALSWNDSTPSRIIDNMTETDNLSDLPILADSLEEAGYRNDFVVSQLRAGNKNAFLQVIKPKVVSDCIKMIDDPIDSFFDNKMDKLYRNIMDAAAGWAIQPSKQTSALVDKRADELIEYHNNWTTQYRRPIDPQDFVKMNAVNAFAGVIIGKTNEDIADNLRLLGGENVLFHEDSNESHVITKLANLYDPQNEEHEHNQGQLQVENYE
jgi:hypothetical protein